MKAKDLIQLCEDDVQKVHQELADKILTGKIDLALLKERGIEDPDKLAHAIRNGKIDHAVLADKLGKDFKVSDVEIEE